MRTPVRIPAGKMAVVTVDLQEEQRNDVRYRVAGWDALLANVMRLQAAARGNGQAVYHSAYVVDPASGPLPPFFPVGADGRPAFSVLGDPLTAICPEVGPADGEPLFLKSVASAFGNPALAVDLKSRGIEWLFICGVWTEACIDATVKDAIAAGFRAIVVKDACSSGTEAMHQTAILNIANRLYGGAVSSTDDACAILGGGKADLWMIEGSVPIRFSYEDAADTYRGL